MTQQRIEDIETKLAYQEQALDELNEIVTRQQSQIDKLEATCRHLLEKLRELGENDDGEVSGESLDQQRPPHY